MMILNLHVPSHCINEVRWIVSVLFDEFLGIPCNIIEGEQKNYNLELAGKSLQLPDNFFNQARKAWLQRSSLPKMPLSTWDVDASGLEVPLVTQDISVLFGDPEITITKNHISLGVDILGTAFFMLSRYEEAVKPDRDHYDRFPATASLAFQAEFLQRPIVNEYLEILWACMELLWPGLKRKPRNYQMQISCDVDRPYQSGIKNPLRQLKHIGGDLVRRKSLELAAKSTINYFATKAGNYSFDSNYSRFDWMMDVNEKAGNKVAFFFLAGRTSLELDGCYSLDEPVIRKLMRRIHERGHEIGLHPSFNTYKDATQLCREADNLRRAMREEGIKQDVLGGRQHYLRWETPTTAQNWEAAGLSYDSTLYFADQAGFRCGVCYEFPLYDVQHRRPVNIVERPLIMMEGTILGSVYNSLDGKDEIIDVANGLAHTIKRFNGDFTILWHNSYFDKSWYAGSYEEIVNL